MHEIICCCWYLTKTTTQQNAQFTAKQWCFSLYKFEDATTSDLCAVQQYNCIYLILSSEYRIHYVRRHAIMEFLSHSKCIDIVFLLRKNVKYSKSFYKCKYSLRATISIYYSWCVLHSYKVLMIMMKNHIRLRRWVLIKSIAFHWK